MGLDRSWILAAGLGACARAAATAVRVSFSIAAPADAGNLALGAAAFASVGAGALPLPPCDVAAAALPAVFFGPLAFWARTGAAAVGFGETVALAIALPRGGPETVTGSGAFCLLPALEPRLAASAPPRSGVLLVFFAAFMLCVSSDRAFLARAIPFLP
jgi:hypothetical protein